MVIRSTNRRPRPEEHIVTVTTARILTAIVVLMTIAVALGTAYIVGRDAGQKAEHQACIEHLVSEGSVEPADAGQLCTFGAER